MNNSTELLKTKCNPDNLEKLLSLNNPGLLDFVSEYVKLCNPSSVFVCTDSSEDAEYIRKATIAQNEETKLKTSGHTIHYDGNFDQARDKANTKFLVTKDLRLGSGLNCIDRDEALKETSEILTNIMQNKQMFVLFFCLGPLNSKFSIYAVQITDSAYVAHSEHILYRPAYAEFKNKGADIEYFRYVHSAGELENSVSKNTDKRRVYIDCLENLVYSVNTQYAGNTVGLKKLALRLAIRKASQEGWLAEHMFVMGVHGKNNRKTYFTGAFPSLCGKTSTCMVENETIVGDDIAYLRKDKGNIFAVNVERGLFGIIKDVGAEGDPLIWEALNTPGEVILSNILVKDGIPYWPGDGKDTPSEGINFSGEWRDGKTDKNGKPVPFAHPNARFTVRLSALKNCDSELDNPEGVRVGGIVYGGRDSDTWPPVCESLDWTHGVISMAASLESETTAATLGQEGVRKFNPMANLDFLSMPISEYINNYIDFAKDLEKPASIFGVNYFLKDKNGKYSNTKHDKRIWLKWMEARVNNEAGAIKTPIGFLPKYEDLKALFKQLLDRDYTEQEYLQQFSLKVARNIEKIDRIIETYKEKISDAPAVLLEILQAQKQRLLAAGEKFGDDIAPEVFAKNSN